MGRPIHIDKVAVLMQESREATRGATLLTLAEKVTLAQGGRGGAGPLVAQLLLCCVHVGVSLGRDGGDVREESQVNVLCWLLPPSCSMSQQGC